MAEIKQEFSADLNFSFWSDIYVLYEVYVSFIRFVYLKYVLETQQSNKDMDSLLDTLNFIPKPL